MTAPVKDADQQAAFQAVREAGDLCLGHIRAMAAANRRIAAKAAAGDPVWGRVAAIGYNQACRDRRGDATGPDDACMAALRASADLKLVCDSRWMLGEARVALRDRLDRLDTIAVPYDDLERCINQAITGPDRSPAELADGIEAALVLGARATAWQPNRREAGTLVDQWKRKLQNNRVVAAIVIIGLVLAGAFALYNAIPDDLRPWLGLPAKPKPPG